MTATRSADAGQIRSLNRTAVLGVMREDGPLTRSPIAHKLGLSFPTVMRITEEPMMEDFVTPLDEIQATGGRPATLLAFNGNAYAADGIDLGGSKMFGTIADLPGKIQHQVYIPWEDQESGDHLQKLCRMIEQLMDSPGRLASRSGESALGLEVSRSDQREL